MGYEKYYPLKDGKVAIGYGWGYDEESKKETIRQRKIDGVFAVDYAGDCKHWREHPGGTILAAELSLSKLGAILHEMQKDEEKDPFARTGRVIIDFDENLITVYNYYVE